MAVAVAALLLTVIRMRGGGSAVEVDVEDVVRREVFRSTVTASGEIVATHYADIGSSVMGRVVDLLVSEGDRVRTGQVVARIDAVQARSAAEAASAQVAALEAEARSAREQLDSARADLEVARARAEEARKHLDRIQRLHIEGVVSTADLDTAQAGAEATGAQLDAARAEVTQTEEVLAAASRRVASARAQETGARDTLSKTEIFAPIDGTVTRLNVREGEMVVIGIQNQPGTTLMTLSDLTSLAAEVKVAEADVLRLEEGQPATVTLEALPDQSFGGRVREIGASALPLTGTAAAAREFRVLVGLDNLDPRLRPGLTCDTEIVTDQRREVLTVPLQAVVVRPAADGAGELPGVFVADGDRARFTAVTPGIIGGIEIEISGAGEGTPVIVGPFQVLRDLTDGARIRPTYLDRR